jgi:hypothetical protein
VVPTKGPKSFSTTGLSEKRGTVRKARRPPCISILALAMILCQRCVLRGYCTLKPPKKQHPALTRFPVFKLVYFAGFKWRELRFISNHINYLLQFHFVRALYIRRRPFLVPIIPLSLDSSQVVRDSSAHADDQNEAHDERLC